MKFSALVAIVSESMEEKAVDVAKQAGAGSVTITKGGSIGLKEKKVFFGLTLEENVSILIFVLPNRLSMKIIKVLKKELDLNNPETNGIAFSMPINHVAGMNIEEIHRFEKEIREVI